MLLLGNIKPEKQCLTPAQMPGKFTRAGVYRVIYFRNAYRHLPVAR